MKSLPTAPAPGSPVSASLIGEIIAAIRARTLLRGRGYRLKETPNGTTLDIERVRGVVGVAAPRTPYWSFSCEEDENTGERTGGWRNCVIQIGFEFRRGWFGKDDWPNEIDGTDLTEDGHYAVRVTTGNRRAEIINDLPDSLEPDFEKGYIYFELGWIIDGKLYQTEHPEYSDASPRSIDVVPVAYLLV